MGNITVHYWVYKATNITGGALTLNIESGSNIAMKYLFGGCYKVSIHYMPVCSFLKNKLRWRDVHLQMYSTLIGVKPRIIEINI